MKKLLLSFTEIHAQAFIGKLTLAVILTLSGIGCINAQGTNTTPFDISDFSLTPSTIDTTDSSQTVTVTIRATDVVRDVSSIVVRFGSLTGNQFVSVSMDSRNRISGNGRDGIYRAAATFPQYSKSGTWNVFEIEVFDGINYKNFYSTDIAARGFATELQVTSNNEDITPPEISDFGFTPSAIDTANGSQTVTVTVRAKDAKAGVRIVSVNFSRPEDDYSYNVSMDGRNRILGDEKDGVYRGVVTFFRNTVSGVYDVSVYASDALFNTKCLRANEVAELGYVSRLRVNMPAAASRSVREDFDGDGKSDISVFRPSNGFWYVMKSSGGFSSIQWGLGTDRLAPGDYDGDGKTDLAVYRIGAGVTPFNRVNNTWYILKSSDNTYVARQWGGSGGSTDDAPVPADYDGDGKTDLAVYPKSDAGGEPGSFVILQSSSNTRVITQWGTNLDRRVPADYDGDGKADLAIYRDSPLFGEVGVWYILQSSNSVMRVERFGLPGDVVVPADYDGDGKADIAVWRPSNGFWYRINSSDGSFYAMQFGLSADKPVPADYDGDGKTDIAVYRNGIWYLQQSRDGFKAVSFGLSTDIPIPNVYVQ